MLNKHIPMEILIGLPTPFVHRLRDLKIKELKEREQQKQNAANNTYDTNGINSMMQDKATIDDLVDELSDY